MSVRPPRDLARELLREVQALAPPKARCSPLDQIHLTLRFLGDTPLDRLDGVAAALERAVRTVPPFPLTVERLATIPPGRRGRLIAAVAAPSPEMTRLHHVVRDELGAADDGRSFLPHLTLCRFARSGPRVVVEQALAPAPFTVERVVLCRSTLRPEGAVHEDLHLFSLGG